MSQNRKNFHLDVSVLLLRHLEDIVSRTKILSFPTNMDEKENRKAFLQSLLPFFFDLRLAQVEELLTDEELPSIVNYVQSEYSNHRRDPVPVFNGGIIPYLEDSGFNEILSFDIKNAKSAADVPSKYPNFFLHRLMRDVCNTVLTFFGVNPLNPVCLVVLAGDEFTVYGLYSSFQSPSKAIHIINDMLPAALYSENGSPILEKAKIRLNSPSMISEVFLREEVEREVSMVNQPSLQKRIDDFKRIQPELMEVLSLLQLFSSEVQYKMLEIITLITYDPFRTILASKLPHKTIGLYKNFPHFLHRLELAAMEECFLIGYIVPNLAKRLVDDKEYGFLVAHKVVRELFATLLTSFNKEEIDKVIVLRQGANFYLVVSCKQQGDSINETIFDFPPVIHCSSLTKEKKCTLPVIFGKAILPMSLIGNANSSKKISIKNEQEVRNKLALASKYMLKDYYNNLVCYYKKPMGKVDYAIEFLTYTCMTQSRRWQNVLAKLGVSADHFERDLSHRHHNSC